MDCLSNRSQPGNAVADSATQKPIEPADDRRPATGPVAAGIPLKWCTIIPGRPPDGLGLFLPSDPDAVLMDTDEDEFFANDERMPYFTALWESAEALVHHIMDGPKLTDLRVLDLGCGAGAVGLAAARRNARVSFFDWEPRAMEMVALSARAQGLTIEDRIAADWREPPPLEPFDLILAADVLYEPRNIDAVCQFVRDHLKPGGQARIADPGRPNAEPFPERARALGLAMDGPEPLCVIHGPVIQLWTVTVPSASH